MIIQIQYCSKYKQNVCIIYYMLLKASVYRLVRFCCSNDCGCCCCGCNGNWKKGNPPPPRAYGICPFHLLIDCHCRYCGSCLNCSVITLIACDSPVALATFALACA